MRMPVTFLRIPLKLISSHLSLGAVTPSPDTQQTDCQYPKPILLNTGYAHFPYEWSPNTVDIQMLRVGNFVMLIVPGELTTMAGRRLR